MTTKNQANSGAAIWFVLLAVFFDAMGHGLLAPIIPELIQQLVQVNVSGAALYGGAIIALFATIQFFATPLLGSLSDAYGRRPVLLMSFTAFGVNYLLMGLAPSIGWLFAAQALAGLFGATPAVAAAFMADITSAEKRAKRFGSLGAAFGLGFMFGPVLSGLLADYGLRTPIFAASVLTLTNAIVGFFVFRESLAKPLRRAFEWRNASPWGVFTRLKVTPQIPRLLLVVLCLHIALNTVPTVWPYFTAYQFQWTAKEIGLSMGLYGLVSILTQGVLVGKISQRFGDLVASFTGMTGLLIGSIAFAFITNQYFILVFIIPSAMGFMTNAGLMSYMSSQVDASNQGALQGAFAATRSVGAIITPLCLPWLFHQFTTPGNAYPVYPGAPFLVAGLLTMCAIALLLRVNRLAKY